VSWQTGVRPVVAEVTRTRAVPGVVVTVARGDGAPDHLVVGGDGAGRPLAADSLFPVASITKPATALAVLRLAAQGKLALDDLLAWHLPEAAAAVHGVTLRRLLSHTAGLPYDVAAEAAPYAPGLDWPTLERACLATALIAPPGTTARYSNVGFGLLGIVVGRLSGRPIPEAITDLVEHAGTELEPFNSRVWRALAMPWACLVTTTAGALALARAFAGMPAGFLPTALLAEATTDQSGELPGSGLDLPWSPAPWGLGIEIRGAKEPHCTPPSVSPRSFGHAGASGCLVWVDPAAGIAWAILGTRTFDAWWPRWAEIGEAILSTVAG
jgi:CubicO group peptidase (beta-lactamase class C family)